MELVNGTPMTAGYTLGVEPSGREFVVVVIKGTFDMPDGDGPAPLAEEQEPLVMADTFTGEPGLSAPVYEADFCLRKPRCDVLLHGQAHAPHGRPVPGVEVSLRVGALTKRFFVLGDRVWGVWTGGIRPTDPQPFETMPITYDRAFGGIDDRHPDPAKHAAHMANPIGRGYHKELADELVRGTPLPNTEARDAPVNRPNGAYQPMAFGPVGRGWTPRLGFAGTYDQNWLDNHFPFLPSDFRDDHYQSAPADQQLTGAVAGANVELTNLSPEGTLRFRLPDLEVPVYFFPKKGGHEDSVAMLDTIVLEPDRRRLMLVWRASRALKQNLFELPQAVVGRRSKAWWRARKLGKTYYRSVNDLVKTRRLRAAEEEGE